MKNKIHKARRKMSRVIDELYTALLLAGGTQVSLEILKREDGLELTASGDFDPVNRAKMERMAEVLQPEVRSPALVEQYWQLAGGDQYTSDSELALVGQMADQCAVSVEESRVSIDLFIGF